MGHESSHSPRTLLRRRRILGLLLDTGASSRLESTAVIATMGQGLLGVGTQMGRKVIRATERLVTSSKIALEWTFLCMNQHVSLQVLESLETPLAALKLAWVLVVGTTAGRGDRCGRADRVVALDLGTVSTDGTCRVAVMTRSGTGVTTVHGAASHEAIGHR